MEEHPRLDLATQLDELSKQFRDFVTAQLQARLQEADRQVAAARQEAEAARKDAETARQDAEAARQEAETLRRRLRHYEFDNGEQLVLFVARRQVGSWDHYTQRSVMLLTKSTLAELLPRITRAVIQIQRSWGIGRATSLQHLTLKFSRAVYPTGCLETYLLQLAELTGLRSLFLGGPSNRIVPVPAQLLCWLRELPVLSRLRIRALALHDSTRFPQLDQLTSLEVSRVTTPSGTLLLSHMPNLRELRLPCPSADCTLQHMPALRRLGIFDTMSVQNLSLLHAVPQIEELTIDYCGGVTDLFLLSPLSMLTRLEMVNTGVRSLQPLAAMTRLQVLMLEHSRKRVDLHPLSGLCNLKFLSLSGSPVSNLEPLTALVNLQVLRAEGKVLSKCLELLSGLPELAIINSGEPVSDMEGCAQIEKLVLDFCKSVQDLNHLLPLSMLTHLEIRGLRVPLHVLATLTRLQVLMVEHCLQPLDLRPLSGLCNLECLSLSGRAGSVMSYLEPLSFLTALEYLDLSGVKVTDVEPLTALRRLNVLRAEGEVLSRCLGLLSGLRQLAILDSWEQGT